jgi:hypothetical protein
MKRTVSATLIGLVLLAAGCTSYYRVSDPTTGKVYYTTELKQDSGATTLTDARTGDSVTVQNVEVRKISKEDYEAGKSAPQATNPPTTNPSH